VLWAVVPLAVDVLLSSDVSEHVESRKANPVGDIIPGNFTEIGTRRRPSLISVCTFEDVPGFQVQQNSLALACPLVVEVEETGKEFDSIHTPNSVRACAAHNDGFGQGCQLLKFHDYRLVARKGKVNGENT
jgi:hypothetical protein